MLGLSASLLDWHWDFWPVPLFSPPVKRGWQVWVFGKPQECLENAVRAAPALRQQGGNPSAETIACSCRNSKAKTEALGQSEDVMCCSLGPGAASSSGCSAVRPSMEQDSGNEYGASRASAVVAVALRACWETLSGWPGPS